MQKLNIEQKVLMDRFAEKKNESGFLNFCFICGYNINNVCKIYSEIFGRKLTSEILAKYNLN